MLSDRDEVVAAFDALDAAWERLAGCKFDGLVTGERLALLERLEVQRRRQPAAEHELVNQLRAQGTPVELGGRLAHALADRLRISRGEARRRIAAAEQLGSRTALSGARMEPLLAATAAAQRAGRIGAEQVGVIRAFVQRLPGWVDVGSRELAEAQLVGLAGGFRPEQVARAADRLAMLLDPDGDFCDEDRARRRGLTLGAQGIDGMSSIRGWVTPQLRAGLEAVWAKWAAPGMCNPDDQRPAVDEPPSQDRAARDSRSTAQRNHDALNALVRSVLSAGVLGRHQSLPVSIIVKTTLQDLQAKAGVATTGGDTVLPMSEVIRMARHANHYLAIFDGVDGRALWLGRTKRLASADQRIVLHARDRGCSHPGCDVPGYLAEVHHVTDWAAGGRTDIDDLTFACGRHNRLVEDGGWTTRKHPNGDTEWIPPPHLDRGQPRTNTYHHPEKLLHSEEDDDDEDDER